MVKINLLNEPQSPAKQDKTQDEPTKGKATKALSAGSASRGACLPLVGILVFLLFVCAGGAYYYWLDRSIKSQQELSEHLTEEKRQLEPYIGLAEQYGAQNEWLSKKENILAKLKKQQQMPVHLWSELENSVPDKVFLMKLTQKGGRLEIRGESLTEDAIFQFKDALDSRSQRFSQVGLGSVMRKGNILEFGISLDLVNP
jgi:Tfp pilus assembly protein PilN